jgi:integrase/recombinase XerD
MVLDPDGRVGANIELHDAIAKKRSGRTIPMHPMLRTAIIRLYRSADDNGAIIRSERGGAMRPHSIVNLFARIYAELGLLGCSSHSGRRTWITRAARSVSKCGGSLRDVQQLAGHRNLAATERYIEGDTAVKRRLVAMI